MQFKEAKTKLKLLACGKCHSINYEEVHLPSGKVITNCSLYLDGLGIYRGATFQEAFLKLENAIDSRIEEEQLIEA